MQSKEIIELKRKLRNTWKRHSNGCVKHHPGKEDAGPVVMMNEKPLEDDNVYYEDEPLTLFVGINIGQGLEDRTIPIPEEKVCIFFADQTSKWFETDKDGMVEIPCPRPPGKMPIVIPDILLYSHDNAVTYTIAPKKGGN